MKPTIGRIVHYVSQDDGRHLAAIISRVRDSALVEELVDLHVFDHFGQLIYSSVPHKEPEADSTAFPGSWHWPERE